ncbi:SDR family oxidoreductase [uncultured Tenacibaculum sp.]|uniref:SDR family NAD(P)-dependent oxidoreductase n=1 Tax=uncultured Tenacibaculum sp. TaxID=174713 RepID=UPI00261AF38B|nr:SDR family NAD(P)-dependent oxidoreductase [uncultured Tenacibaculum sp.]
MNLKKLNALYPNKTAFVTGAGSGLGAAFAKLLAKNNWTLHLSDINEKALESVIQNLNTNEKVFQYSLDVSDKNQFENVVHKVYENSETVDLVINNAGIGDGLLFKDYPIEKWEKMIEVNLMGTYYGCHFFVPRLLKQKKGVLLNVGSSAGFMNAPGMSAYSVSKAAVFSLSESLYHELKLNNIHVSVLTPTFFKTNIMENASSKMFKGFAEKQMKHSTTNADEVAAIALEKASEGKFQIIYPKDAKTKFFYKKWLPKLVEKQYQKMMSRLSHR